MKKLFNMFSSACHKLVATWIQEYRFIFSDTAVIFSFFVISIGVSFAYTYLYSGQVLQDLPIAVVDNDHSTESRLLLRMIDQTPQTQIAYNVTELGKAQQLFQEQKVRGIITIPTNFAKKVSRGMRPAISVYADASYMLYYTQVFKAVKTAVGYMNVGIEIKKLTASGLSYPQAMQTSQPIQAVTVSLYNPDSGYATFIMPVIYLIIIQTTMLTGIGLLGGTYQEKKLYKSTPIKITNLLDATFIVFGKSGAYTSIGFFTIFVILGFVFPTLGIPQRGNIGDVLLFLLPFIFTISFLGIMLNAFFKHREDAVMTIVFTSIPAMLLCGISWPVTEIPPFMQEVAKLIPSTIATKGFIAITQGGADFYIIKDMWMNMWILCSFYFILSLFSMKKLSTKT